MLMNFNPLIKLLLFVPQGEDLSFFSFVRGTNLFSVSKFTCSPKKESEKLKNSHFGQIHVQFVLFTISYWVSAMNEHSLWMLVPKSLICLNLPGVCHFRCYFEQWGKQLCRLRRVLPGIGCPGVGRLCIVKRGVDTEQTLVARPSWLVPPLRTHHQELLPWVRPTKNDLYPPQSITPNAM